MSPSKTRSIRVNSFTTIGEFMAYVLPNAIADLDELNILDDLEFIGENVRISTGTVITPPLFSAFGGRKWLEEFTAPPRSKQIIKKLRSTYFDGVLCAIRALNDSNTDAVVGFGEGGLIAGGGCLLLRSGP